MKSRTTLALSGIMIAAGIIVAFWKGASQETKKTADTPRESRIDQSTAHLEKSRQSENSDHVPIRTPPKELPSLLKSNRDDPSTTEELINIISLHPKHKERLIKENQWIKRREIVEQKESFRQIGKRILNGEDIKEFEIPLFDGETATFVIGNKDAEVVSEKHGSFRGQIKEEPNSFAVLSYYEEASAGYFTVPSRGLTIQYDGWGERRVIVKDHSPGEFARAVPCRHCQEIGSEADHDNHAAPKR